MSKILMLISAILIVSSCSSGYDTGPGKIGSTREVIANDGIFRISERYRMASEGLDVFDEINSPLIDADANASDRVFFGTDSAVVDPSEQITLDKQVKWLRKNGNAQIIIEGHCDERGTREYNLALGERRAQAVKEYLITSGIRESRMTTVSFGKERPAVIGSGASAHAENRRAVTLLK